MFKSSPVLLAWFCSLLVTIPAGAADTSLAQLTAVVYNQTQPESVALAKFYAQQRAIPRDHLVGLNCSTDEEIGRDDFETTIAEPLRQVFRERHWWTFRTDSDGEEKIAISSIRFVALIRGVPLKIRGTPEPYPGDEPGTGPIASHNEASVDSELSVLAYANRHISGAITNPYFQGFRAIRDFENPNLLLVCRLDAPTPEIVRRMISDSIATEKAGLWGRGYIDATHGSAPGAEGDKWMEEIVGQLQRTGIPVVFDDAPSTFPSGFPMNDCALYYGWYAGGVNGPFTDPDFRFLAGAVAVHIHSFSAGTLRDPNAGWVAPLLARGAAASCGNVYEPYLQLTSHLDILNDRLLHGFTFAESGYMSLPALSWMSILVGDPLYRPYSSWLQLDSTRDASRSGQEWRAYHEFAIKNASRPPAEYRQLARQMAARTRSGAMFEDLARMEEADGNLSGANGYLQQARACYTKRDDILRAVIEQCALLIRDNKSRRAFDLIRSVLRVAPDAPAAALLRKMETDAKTSPVPSPTAH